MGELSIGKLLIVGALIVLIFGSGKLRNIGTDIGAAIKGFKKSMTDDDSNAKSTTTANNTTDATGDRLSHKD